MAIEKRIELEDDAISAEIPTSEDITAMEDGGAQVTLTDQKEIDAADAMGLLDEEQNGLPLVGHVAAGEAILAIENIEDYIEVTPNMFYPKADFFLKVRGASMRNIGIMDGDLLAVHKTNIAENGEIVVARIEDEVTVKRIRTNSVAHEIKLMPENDDFKPINVDLRKQNFSIEGISVGVLRTKI